MFFFRYFESLNVKIKFFIIIFLLNFCQPVYITAQIFSDSLLSEMLNKTLSDFFKSSSAQKKFECIFVQTEFNTEMLKSEFGTSKICFLYNNNDFNQFYKKISKKPKEIKIYKLFYRKIKEDTIEVYIIGNYIPYEIASNNILKYDFNEDRINTPNSKFVFDHSKKTWIFSSPYNEILKVLKSLPY